MDKDKDNRAGAIDIEGREARKRQARNANGAKSAVSGQRSACGRDVVGHGVSLCAWRTRACRPEQSNSQEEEAIGKGATKSGKKK